jgi:uncharacterized protein YprB with RNaseH-like and TPR domain/predicted nuclease with RNAse H fold
VTSVARASGRALLPETFVHLAGIGLKTESRLWRSGVGSWDDLGRTRLARRPAVAEGINRSKRALVTPDLGYFFEALPPSERWRTYADFRDRFAAIDIETTGMSIYDQLTIVGIELGGEYRTFVRGANLADAEALLSTVEGLISFNGALFDLPFLARAFPRLVMPRTHIDLRFLSRRVGWAGSLKKVERLARLRRERDLDDLNGYEATVLWAEYEHGDVAALRKLIRYNASDACVLRPLADLIVGRLQADLYEARSQQVDDHQLSLVLDALAPAVRRVARKPPRPPRIKVGRDRLLHVGPQTVALPEPRQILPAVTLDQLHARMARPRDRVVGIDLTGSDSRPSGWALVEGDLVLTGMLSTFDEILRATLAVRPRLVSIDSPLSLPIGRHCTNDACKCRPVGGITRHCERELKRRGINVYPCLIRSMQALTRRGIQLAKTLRSHGIDVIESYPGAAQDIMRIPRKRASQEQLRAGLKRFGLRGIRPAGLLTHDELDAVTSAAVGVFYLADLYEALGNADEDFLIIPSVDSLPDGPVEGSASPVADPRLFIIGRESEPIRRALGRLAADVGDWPAFWERAGEAGASLRVAHVLEPGTRKPRRPVFGDICMVEDDVQLTRRVRRWAREWTV